MGGQAPSWAFATAIMLGSLSFSIVADLLNGTCLPMDCALQNRRPRFAGLYEQSLSFEVDQSLEHAVMLERCEDASGVASSRNSAI